MGKPNAMYVMGGGGTPVISASAYGLIHRTFEAYRDKVGTFLAAVGGMRGALNEDVVDVFGWALQDGGGGAASRMNRLKWPATPVFGTSRHKPDNEDCERLMELFKAHGVNYVFLNGGNDTQEKAIILSEFAKKQNYELHVIGIPKTVDNDLLVTHRCPGYASFAKQVALVTASLQGDIDAFGIPVGATRGGALREGAVSQVAVFMGRDEGWGAAASVMAKIDDSYGPHVILTKEGGFNKDAFLARCQDAYDKYGNLFVVASEGAHDGEQYLGYHLEVACRKFDTQFKVHTDAHKNTSVSDGRVALFLKLLIEKELKVPTGVFSSMKTRAEGPDYLNRNNLEIMSEPDFRDAIAVGVKAADLAFGPGPVDGVMVTLQSGKCADTGVTPLNTVADSVKGSKAMTKSLKTLGTPERPILSKDGMMVDKALYEKYIADIIDLNGPNRREVLAGEGFKLPLARIEWPFAAKKLKPYQKAAKKA
ncbi:MAG: 6-phosphofructokinase [Candidatus Coatesbacteria bacterium]